MRTHRQNIWIAYCAVFDFIGVKQQFVTQPSIERQKRIEYQELKCLIDNSFDQIEQSNNYPQDDVNC